MRGKLWLLALAVVTFIVSAFAVICGSAGDIGGAILFGLSGALFFAGSICFCVVMMIEKGQRA